MRLLLTSTGLAEERIRNFFIDQFDNLDDKTACIVSSGRTAEEQFYIDESIQEMSDLGLKVTEINIAKKDSFENLPEFDIYYVCGGNTFFILDRMRKTGIDKILIDAIRSDKFYIGVSAGSIIPGPNIEISGWKNGWDRNDVNLEDLTGFNMVSFVVTPHYEDRHREAVEKFKKERKGMKVVKLTDEQAIFVDNKGCELV